MNSEEEPLLPPSPSLLSLPDDIVNNCLARISKSYYPKLSLVSKTFRSLILSYELRIERFHFKTQEMVLYACLELPCSGLPSWFSLWIKPDQTLTNDIEKKKNKATGNTLLVPIPSSYSHREPMFLACLGSDIYAISQCHPPSSVMLVRNKEIHLWRQAPDMTVPRANPIVCVLDGKIYVMGGCATNESTYWAEVFDTKTQTWEPLPDPGAELSLSKIQTIKVINGKLYVKRCKEEGYVYDPKEGKWGVTRNVYAHCTIDNVWYFCDIQSCKWYDTKHESLEVVRGLDMLDKNLRRGLIEIVNYGGKLLILWDEDCCQQKDIWCAVIALNKRNGGDEVWGKIEWASVVRTVPSSYVFLRTLLNAV